MTSLCMNVTVGEKAVENELGDFIGELDEKALDNLAEELAEELNDEELGEVLEQLDGEMLREVEEEVAENLQERFNKAGIKGRESPCAQLYLCSTCCQLKLLVKGFILKLHNV